VSKPLLRQPRVVGVELRPPFAGLWRARRGEYRVRYRIDDDASEVTVLDVQHRRDAYRG
jgi:mRNA interferase RelE/StbE